MKKWITLCMATLILPSCMSMKQGKYMTGEEFTHLYYNPPTRGCRVIWAYMGEKNGKHRIYHFEGNTIKGKYWTYSAELPPDFSDFNFRSKRKQSNQNIEPMLKTPIE